MIPVTTLLEQKVFLRGYQKFELHSADEIEVTFKRFSIHRQFKIPLWQVLPNPERIKAGASGSIVGLVIFGLITLGLIIGSCAARDVGLAEALMFPTVMFGIVFFACLWNFRVKSINAMVYHFRQGGQIHVWFEKPNTASFKAFCDTLTKRAEQAWQNRPVDSTNSLAGEIAALKKLVESGALTEMEFQKAKDKLISVTDERRIGFK